MAASKPDSRRFSASNGPSDEDGPTVRRAGSDGDGSIDCRDVPRARRLAQLDPHVLILDSSPSVVPRPDVLILDPSRHGRTRGVDVHADEGAGKRDLPGAQLLKLRLQSVPSSPVRGDGVPPSRRGPDRSSPAYTARRRQPRPDVRCLVGVNAGGSDGGGEAGDGDATAPAATGVGSRWVRGDSGERSTPLTGFGSPGDGGSDFGSAVRFTTSTPTGADFPGDRPF